MSLVIKSCIVSKKFDTIMNSKYIIKYYVVKILWIAHTLRKIDNKNVRNSNTRHWQKIFYKIDKNKG